MATYSGPQYYQNGNRARDGGAAGALERMALYSQTFPRHFIIGLILFVALGAFEIFNFDTTKFALSNLLGDISFFNVSWAAVLAIAFCSIDFAGLIRLFSPTEPGEEGRESYFMMGAWLLGATMNAMMTWWAVSITLLNHPYIGNEVLGREDLIKIVPVFVAVLVWLTRILFIGAFTIAGERLASYNRQYEPVAAAKPKARKQAAPKPKAQGRNTQRITDELPTFVNGGNQPIVRKQPQRKRKTVPTFTNNRRRSPMPAPKPRMASPAPQANQQNRVKNRPPMPRGTTRRAPMMAKGRSKPQG